MQGWGSSEGAVCMQGKPWAWEKARGNYITPFYIGQLGSSRMHLRPTFVYCLAGIFHSHIQGIYGTGKTGKMAKTFPVRENTGNLEVLPKHREFCLLKL